MCGVQPTYKTRATGCWHWTRVALFLSHFSIEATVKKDTCEGNILGGHIIRTYTQESLYCSIKAASLWLPLVILEALSGPFFWLLFGRAGCADLQRQLAALIYKPNFHLIITTTSPSTLLTPFDILPSQHLKLHQLQ